MDQYKDNAYFFLDLYNVEIALKNKVQADEFYYKYLSLSHHPDLKKDAVYTYKEFASENRPILASKNLNNLEFFPYVLENDRVKYLTISDFQYLEPTSPMLFRNYLTYEVGYTDPDFNQSKIIKQPEKISDGYSFNAFCLNKSQDKIYMTRYDGNSKRMVICVSEKEGISWGPFRTMQYIVKHPKFNFMHPMLTENEDQLVFSSDMTPGSGGYDLWIADLTEIGDIKHLKNLGKKINTSGNECFPTMYNQNTIFFSSDGHHGYGSLDLYKVDIDLKENSSPINLGASFNSSRDDYGLFYLKDAKTAFFTSNRSVSNTNIFIDKIYKIKLNILDCEILSFEIKSPFVNKDIIATSPESNLSATDVEQVASIKQVNDKTFDEALLTIAAQNKLEEPAKIVPAVNINTTQNTSSKADNDYSSNGNKATKVETNRTNEFESKINNETAPLYNLKNDKIEEKFVQFSNNASIPSLKTEQIIENKYWTTAKLWFKDFDIAIGYTYIRVINPKHEVVYSNYSTQNGMISVEVVEDNEYTIEIPRFKTMLQGVVFSKNENNFYFPYQTEQTSTISNIPINKSNKDKKFSTEQSTSRIKKIKPKTFYTNSAITKAPIISANKKTTTPNKQNNIQTKRPSKQTTKPNLNKKEAPTKPAPKNMIENFN
jgi:hypothetical protein